MSLFGLYVALIVFVMLGLAVDAMNAEYRRTQIQTTCDRSVLAAADLDQPFEPAEVVRSYFDAAGLASVLDGDPEIAESLNARTVSATASEAVGTFFLHMVGKEDIAVAAECGANETIPNVEISLVLDISGSMRFGTSNGLSDRIGPLRTAAKDFAATVLQGQRATYTTITIVPYAGQVNPGRRLFDAVGGDRVHNHSSCIVFDTSEFTHTGLPNASTEQVPHFHNWGINWSYMDWGWCPTANQAILPFASNLTTIEDYIDALRLHDGTGTQIGMKWGLALLDPDSEDVVTQLRTAGEAGPISVNRPTAWEAEDTVKVIVLMTDGKITEQVTPRQTGPVFWQHDERDVLASVDPNTNYWTLHDTGAGVDIDAMMTEFVAALNDADPSDTGVSLHYGEVSFSDGRNAQDMLDLIAEHERTAAEAQAVEDANDAAEAAHDAAQDALEAAADALGQDYDRVPFSPAPVPPVSPGLVLRDEGFVNLTDELKNARNHLNQKNKGATQTSGSSTNVTSFDSICDLAKAQGVTVYTIAFEAPSSAQNQMRDCATADSHFFDVRDREIETAFRAIAGQINELRLVE